MGEKKERRSSSVSKSKHEDINFQGTCGKTPPIAVLLSFLDYPHPPLVSCLAIQSSTFNLPEDSSP